MSEFTKGAQAALQIFDRMCQDGDWQGQVSMAFAATFDQYVHHAIDTQQLAATFPITYDQLGAVVDSETGIPFSVFACRACGALVNGRTQQTHTNWHATTDDPSATAQGQAQAQEGEPA